MSDEPIVRVAGVTAPVHPYGLSRPATSRGVGGETRSANSTFYLMHLKLGSLLERASVGDQDAFAIFFDETVEAALRLARAAAPDHEAVEALLFRSYLEAWTRAASFPTAGRGALVWLLCIVNDAARADRERAGAPPG